MQIIKPRARLTTTEKGEQVWTVSSFGQDTSGPCLPTAVRDHENTLLNQISGSKKEHAVKFPKKKDEDQ